MPSDSMNKMPEGIPAQNPFAGIAEALRAGSQLDAELRKENERLTAERDAALLLLRECPLHVEPDQRDARSHWCKRVVEFLATNKGG